LRKKPRMLESIFQFIENNSAVENAFYATIFTWLSTVVGASFVFFFRRIHRKFFDGMLGFTGGVMLAASFWSLLAPSIAMNSGEGIFKVLPTGIGFVLGALFIYGLDQILPHLHVNFKSEEKEGVDTNWRRSTLLFLAITLHNIPEGLAIGVMFGGVAMGLPEATVGGAFALTIGIALQNLPEGLAVAMPIRRGGASRKKSFMYGQFSAIVEPVFGVLGALAVAFFTPILPYALAFAAGAMIYVVVEEVIPETQRDKYTDIATLGFILGFVLMMSLDVVFS